MGSGLEGRIAGVTKVQKFVPVTSSEVSPMGENGYIDQGDIYLAMPKSPNDSPGLLAATLVHQQCAQLISDARKAVETNKLAATSKGASDSFYIGPKKKRLGVFKPMEMEPGMTGNVRLAQRYKNANGYRRSTIAPGQAAGNEALCYALDYFGFKGHYGAPKTFLMRLEHPKFHGKALGSFQEFLGGYKMLSKLTDSQKMSIPREQFDRLNLRLISGSTDAHYGNLMWDAKNQQMGLIDAGYDFPGSLERYRFRDPWIYLPQASQPMSKQELDFLKNLNIEDAMTAFCNQAASNKKEDGRLRVSTDKSLYQRGRVELAKVAGELGLTQSEWYYMMEAPKPERKYQRVWARLAASWPSVQLKTDDINKAVKMAMQYTPESPELSEVPFALVPGKLIDDGLNRLVSFVKRKPKRTLEQSLAQSLGQKIKNSTKGMWLTREDWKRINARLVRADRNRPHFGEFKRIFNKYVSDKIKIQSDYKVAEKMVDWSAMREELTAVGNHRIVWRGNT